MKEFNARWVGVSVLGLMVAALGGCSKDQNFEPRSASPQKRSPVRIQTLSQQGDYQPAPLPTTVRVESSGPRVQLWNNLTDQQRKLASHLIRAAEYGKDILYFQGHRHALLIKSFLEEVLLDENRDDVKALLGDGFSEFLVYATKFFDQAGPYTVSNRKIVLRKVTADQVSNLLRIYSERLNAQTRGEIVSLLTDPKFEVIQYPEDEGGTDLLFAGGNLYEKGITGAEVDQAMKAGLLESRVNCRIVRDSVGNIKCQVQALSTPDLAPSVKRALQKIVRELRLSIPYALTDHQKRQLELMVEYLEKGNESLFREYNREWVKDRSASVVDFMISFVEVYEDFRGKIGSWESYVQIVDPETTRQSQALAQHAQSFENDMPYGQWKKTFPEGYSPPALMVYYFQEVASIRSAGYNLPNYDDIRKETGAKNVIKLPLPGMDNDPNAKIVKREWLKEFGPASRLDSTDADSEKAWKVLVLLHEIIGHGSGTYDESKYPKGADPVQTLGALGSALEEQRADLAALVFADNPALVSVGIYQNQEEARRVRNAMYDFYSADFLRRLSRQRTVTEAHQRGHWLFTSMLLEKGAVKFVNRDGSADWTPENVVLEVTDYEVYHRVAVEALAELQRIKAERDEATLAKIFAEKAPLDVINMPWAKGVISRGEKLLVNQGSVEQPWRVDSDGKIQLLGTELTLEGIAGSWARVR